MKRCLILFLMSVIMHSASADNIVMPDGAGYVNIKSAYGAKGDGRTDDTAALQAVFDDRRAGKVSRVYFPDGVYLISKPVGIYNGTAHSNDRFLRFQGQSESGTIIKIKDHAPAFADPQQPGIAVCFYQGKSTGDAMHSYMRNMTIDTGTGNPGAIGFRFLSNNTGAIERLTIRSGDGRGLIGLDMRQGQNGPALAKHVSIDGFKTGIASGNTFSLVYEHIRATNVGVGYELGGRITMRGFACESSGPAIVIKKHGELTLIEGDFQTTGDVETAVVADNSMIFVRDLKTRGFRHSIKAADGTLIDGDIDEWYDGKGQSLFGSDPKSLRLPIVETPEVPWENDPEKWIFVRGERGEDVTMQLQKAIDDGADGSKSTVCIAGNRLRITGPIRVHGSINRIIGMANVVDVVNADNRFEDGKHAVFTFEDLTSDVLIVERFFLLGGWDAPKNIAMFANRSGKVIVVKNVNQRGITKRPEPGNTWFFEDFSPAREATLPVGKGEKVWCRQLNTETPKVDMVSVDGGQLWILGLKTEGRTTHIKASNGAKVELLGGVSYQSWKNQAFDPPVFDVNDSEASFTIGFYHWNQPFSQIVSETSDGQTKTLGRGELNPYHLPIYRTAK